MQTDNTTPIPPLASEFSNTTRSLAQADPWGILVIGSPHGVGPLCSEASRLGFELFRSRALTQADSDRLRDCDWAAAVVIEDGSDLAVTKAMLETSLGPAVPLVWVGAGTEPRGTRPFVRLAKDIEAEHIAATVFDRARTCLYPAYIPREIRQAFGRVLRDWDEDQLGWGPVWLKNHLTPPYSMTVTLEVFGDVSGELSVSAAEAWFAQKARIHPRARHDGVNDASQAAAAIGGALLDHLVSFFEDRGADLSAGGATIHEGSALIVRHLSHRPALCLEFSTRDNELLVVEFSGTGLDTLEVPTFTSSDLDPPEPLSP